MVLRECPYCHRPVEAELLSKVQVDSNELTRVDDFPMEGGSMGRVTRGGLLMSFDPLMLGLSEDEKTAVAMNPEAYLTYKITYRCKHCGKDWTKLSTEAKSLPREYAEDNED